jgi:hypothetical protein
MVVDDFHVLGSVVPAKADAEPIVDLDGMLADPVAGKGLEAIAGWAAQVFKAHRRVNSFESATCHLEQVRGKSLRAPPAEYGLGSLILEAPDHRRSTRIQSW